MVVAVSVMREAVVVNVVVVDCVMLDVTGVGVTVLTGVDVLVARTVKVREATIVLVGTLASDDDPCFVEQSC